MKDGTKIKTSHAYQHQSTPIPKHTEHSSPLAVTYPTTSPKIMLSKLSLALLATTAAAIPTALDARAPYAWDVRGFTSTCTAATCRYDFNVSGPAGPNKQPSFDAYGCEGTSVQGEYKPCTILGIDVPGNVKTQEFGSDRDAAAIISVQYTFEQ